MKLVGQTAFVSGGSRGIGRAVVLELARLGADVAFVFKSDSAAAAATVAEAQSLGRRVEALQCDVTDAAKVADTFDVVRKTLGAPDMIVASAGATAPTKPVRELTPDEWAAFINTDLNGTYNVIHHAVRNLTEQSGSIVAISSIAAQMVPPKNSCGAAAKAGVEALIRVVAREEARRNIRANVVSVGITDTDIIKPIFEKWGPDATQRVISQIPLQRIGTPKDVASMVAFLLSEDATYITGKVLQVDGGQFISG